MKLFLTKKYFKFYAEGYLAKTYFVFDSIKFIGFFSIIILNFNIEQYSKKTRKDISGNHLANNTPTFYLSLLAKNYQYKKENLGHIILEIAEQKVRELQKEIGIRTLILTHDDEPHLHHFYETAGFTKMQKELLEGKERISCIKYL